MLDALYIASTSLHAQQDNINGISNNLANVNTPAFKKSRAMFDDLMYREPISSSSALQRVRDNMQVGMGAGVMDNSKVFTVGDLRPTENALDIAIRGKGFIEIELENGELAYTRTGSLRIDAEGYIETKSGDRLSSRIQVPPDASQIVIDETGVVLAKIGQQDALLDIGNIDLVNFLNTSSLRSAGEGVYLATDNSGPAMYSTPGDDGAGTLVQGFLEASNVDMIEELTELVLAQRAYQVNSQVIRASDEMMQTVNNLRS